ncbi:insulinase family protein [Myxococcota bacterium]|nr:insulinase family protein [Myxococcota bacterium]
MNRLRNHGIGAPRALGSIASSIGLGLGLVLLASGCGLFRTRPAWEEPPPAPSVAPIVSAKDLHRTTLANGIEVLVLEDPRLPRVALGVTLRSGAGSVAPEKAGVAELAAEVLQRGAGTRDALALARVIEDVGASLSVSAGWDATTVSLAGLSKDRALFEEILADVTLRPRFDAAELEKARGEHLAGLAAAVDEPSTLVRWHFLRTLYAGHRYGLPEAGSIETVAKLSLGDVRAYWNDRFIARGAIFWAVGDVDAATFTREIEARYGFLPDRGSVPVTPPSPPRAPEARRIVVVDEPELGQAHILIGHEGIARSNPDRIAIDLMNDALGGSGFSSRLMKVVRAKNGLTYSIGSGFGLRSQPGPFQVMTFTKVETVRQVVDLVLEEMAAIRDARPIDEEELAKFKSYSAGSFGLSLETSGAVLSSLVDLEVHGLPADSLDTFRARVGATTLDEVRAAAKARLHPERAAIIVLGPAEKLVPQLESLGKVEVVRP